MFSSGNGHNVVPQYKYAYGSHVIIKTVVDYTGSAILVVEGEDLIVLDNRSPIREVQLMQPHFPLKDLGPIWETMISRESINMPDVRDDTYLAQAFRAALGELGETTFSYVRACMVIPLSLKEEVMECWC